MAICNNLEAIAKACENNKGGIREIYIWDMEDVTAQTDNGGSFSVDLLTIPAVPTGYYLKRNISNFTEDAAEDFTAGSNVHTLTINLMFLRREAAKSKAIKILGDGQRYLGVLIKDANGIYWVGDDVQLSTVGEGSGTANADGSKYAVVLTAVDNDHSMYVMSEVDALAFIATGTTV